MKAECGRLRQYACKLQALQPGRIPMPSTLPFRLPDYQGGSLCNLAASLAAELGGPDTGLPPLTAPWLAGVGRHRHVALILIDGMGSAQLEQLGPDSVLRRHQAATVDAVFPPTTSASITSLMTGLAPAAHGLTGWHVLARRGLPKESIVTPLPLSTRSPRAGALMPVALAQILLTAPPLFDCLARPARVLQPHYIAGSPYSLHHAGQAERLAWQDTADAFGQLAAGFSAAAPAFHYLYLPQLDSLMHRAGTSAPAVKTLFDELDRSFAALFEAADAHDAALLVTADHGFVDTPRERLISLDEDYPSLYAMLRAPLSGERRAAFCHVKPGMKAAFLAQAQLALGHACHVVDSQLLLHHGAFGPGAHPELALRAGDVALLAKDDWSLRDTLPDEKPHHLPGQHGGISDAERLSPLILRLPRKN